MDYPSPMSSPPSLYQHSRSPDYEPIFFSGSREMNPYTNAIQAPNKPRRTSWSLDDEELFISEALTLPASLVGDQCQDQKIAFREGSPLAPVSNSFGSPQMRFGSAQQMHERQKMENDDRILQQQMQRTSPVQTVPKTISPRDALLEMAPSSLSLLPLVSHYSLVLNSPEQLPIIYSALTDDGLAETIRKIYESTEGPNVQVGRTKYPKIKRGLSGFINTTRASAIADTGSAQNVISAAYALDLKLPIEHTSSSFRVGNSKTVQSIGTVKLDWAFAEDPTKKYNLLFHVLPTCIYDVILGSAFLTATETLSKYRRRLTECVFSIARVFRFGFLGNRCHRLEGVLDSKYPVLAVPDTGAERNVMDAWYAKSHGFYINTGPGTQNVLQFADGSYQETIGQVTTNWTFGSSEKVLLTFEVLEDCASEVVIGEDFIFEHSIFADHESSLRMLEFDGDSYELAPFDFLSSWQQKYLNVKSKLQNKNAADITSPQNSRASTDSHNERLRRDIWNHKFEFGSKASPEEMQAEAKRIQDYKSSHIPRIPSLPTSSSGASRLKRTGTANVPNFSRPHAR